MGWTEYPATDVPEAWAVLLDEALAYWQHQPLGEERTPSGEAFGLLCERCKRPATIRVSGPADVVARIVCAEHTSEVVSELVARFRRGIHVGVLAYYLRRS